MAKKTWKKFPHPDKSFAYAGAALEKHWELRLKLMSRKRKL